MITINRCRKVTIGFVALTLALAAGIYVAWTHLSSQAKPFMPPPEAIRALYATRLPDEHGTLHSLADWQGKTLVVNFWATWCPPCREEMPALARLQQKHAERGVQIIGIAVDNVKSVADYSSRQAVGYPVLIAESEGGSLMQQLGNRTLGLPFTLVLRANGDIALTQMGRVTEKQLEDVLQ